MSLRKLKKMILKNEGGTLDTKLKEVKKTFGYMVALKGFEKIISIDELDKKTLREYQEKADRLGAYIGFWVDLKTGLLYLDISIYISNYMQAIAKARANKQLAIWDFKNQTSIYLDEIQF